MSSQDIIEEAAEQVTQADPAKLASVVREAGQGMISLLVAAGTATLALQKFRSAYEVAKAAKSA